MQTNIVAHLPDMRPIDRQIDDLYAALAQRQPVASARARVASIYSEIQAAEAY
jgi:hypothetical protein